MQVCRVLRHVLDIILNDVIFFFQNNCKEKNVTVTKYVYVRSHINFATIRML